MTDQTACSLPPRDHSPALRELIAAYEAGPQEIRAAVAGMTPDELRCRPVPGRWSTLEVVCHLADCEQLFADRLKRTLAMPHPLLMGADASRYPDALAYQEHDLEEELHLVEVTRRQMARSLRRAPSDAWDRTAVHSETGLLSLRQLLERAVGHVRHHLKFVAEKRAAMGKTGR